MRRTFESPLEIADELKRIGAEYQRVVLDALLLAVDNPIMSESAAEVPVRTGQLRRSGTNQEAGGPPDTEMAPGRTSVTFGYGTTYGIYVHEILDNYHKPPTKAKFLEDSVNRNTERVRQLVEDEVAKVLGGG